MTESSTERVRKWRPINSTKSYEHPPGTDTDDKALELRNQTVARQKRKKSLVPIPESEASPRPRRRYSR